MTIAVTWTSIEIGYQSWKDQPEICSRTSDKPDDQKQLENMFFDDDIEEMENGGSTTIDITEADYEKDNHWAAAVLQTQLNRYLVKAGKQPNIRIDPEVDFCRMETHSVSLNAEKDPPIKAIDTRCVLRGDKWINIRTYFLNDSETGEPWQPDGPLVEQFFTATLSWPCYPVTHSRQK